MAGKIRRIIDQIVNERARGNKAVANTTTTKLILKGINPDRFSAHSDDDPAIIEQLAAIAKEMGVRI